MHSILVRARLLLVIALLGGVHYAHAQDGHVPVDRVVFDFFGDTLRVDGLNTAYVDFQEPLSAEHIRQFYEQMDRSRYGPVIAAILQYRQEHHSDDWVYYQLIRKTAQFFSPKEVDYHRYTLYKWYFLSRSGYDARLRIAGSQLLFYVWCDENIYDIPYHERDGRKYVCLNYHDYGYIDFRKTTFSDVPIDVPGAKRPFSYKLTHMPGFAPGDYTEKDIEFSYYDVSYKFTVKVNPKVNTILKNYPSTDYQAYFNASLSSETYNSLMPQLRDFVKGMSLRQGVSHLMLFTRNAFPYEADSTRYGKDKRMLPEQTLLLDSSDCEDRAALFFYLVKEIYNLPMIVLLYPDHVSVAVKLDKQVGKPVVYNGEKYTICEPTPQKRNLPIGRVSHKRRAQQYTVAFAYTPAK